jgi:hypothetical protein
VRKPAITSLAIAAVLVPAPGSALGQSGGSSYSPTPSTPGKPVVSGNRAKLKGKVAYAPANAPDPIKKLIWAVNKIQNKPYLYGGGHARVPTDRGYDCSGTVSYALYYAGILDGGPRVAPGFYTWGKAGKGRWLTVYANGGHSYLEVAGLRLDTSRMGDTNGESGPRWRRTLRDTSSFRARSWPGL